MIALFVLDGTRISSDWRVGFGFVNTVLVLGGRLPQMMYII